MNAAVAPSRSAPDGALRRTLLIIGDIALFVAGFVVTIPGIMNVPTAAFRTDEGIEPTQLGAALFFVGLLLWITVFVRRTLPILPLIGGAILATIGVDYLLLLIGTYHALLSWPRRRLLLGIGASALVIGFVLRDALGPWGDEGIIATAVHASAAAPGDDVAVVVMTALIAAVSLLTCLGTAALTWTRRERRTESARADQERDRASSLSTELERSSERTRLARDIHDALAHRLSVISLQSGALEQATRSQDAAVAHAAQVLRQQAHASLDDLRGLLGELRRDPAMIGEDDAAVPPSMASMRAIGHLIRSMRESGAVVDAFVLIEDADEAGAALDRTVYRIVQEGLTNALKHAPGAPLAVYVDAAAAKGVRIRISNPLVAGATPNTSGGGRGITGIRERVEMFGGTAWVGDSEGQFIVDVTLPWPAAE